MNCKKLIKKYQDNRELLIEFNPQQVAKRSYRVIRTDLLSAKNSNYSKADSVASQRAFIRHDSEKLARVLMVILELGEYEGIINEIV